MAAKFPPCPVAAPGRWVSVDPAGGAKPTLAVVWQGGDPTEIVKAHRETRVADLAPVFAGAEVVVIESGHGRSNMQTAMLLAHARGVIEGAAQCAGALVVYVTPEQWRGVHGLPKRAPRGQTTAVLHRAEKALCERLAPVRPMFAQATNEDTRAALLIGEACAVAWGWTPALRALPAKPQPVAPVVAPAPGTAVRTGKATLWHRAVWAEGPRNFAVACNGRVRQPTAAMESSRTPGAAKCPRCWQ